MARAATKRSTRTDKAVSATPTQSSEENAFVTLDGNTQGKLVLFRIPKAKQVEGGPVRRGFIELKARKVDVAGWIKTGRESGTEYLSLKVGTLKPRGEGGAHEAADEWLVGPYYGRLFYEAIEVDGVKRVQRYFGFIEDSHKIGDDPATQKGIYETRWQLQIKAKPAVSADQQTHYISGTVHPRAPQVDAPDEDCPF